MKKKLSYVTGSKGKFEEVYDYLMHVKSSIELEQVELPLIEMQGLDLRAIAVAKARQAYAQLKRPLLVDDAGIYFEKYNQFPGVMTSFVYKAIGMEGIFKLIEQGDRIYRLLYLVYVDDHGQEHVFEGRCSGTVIKPTFFKKDAKRPFDDIFFPDGSSVSYSDLLETPAHIAYAYRLKAVQALLDWMNK